MWHYLYKAVDKAGATIDFMLSKKRDKKAAEKFFRKSIGYSGQPQKVTFDKRGSNNSALQSINNEINKSSQILIRKKRI